MTGTPPTPDRVAERRSVVRDSLGVGVATGAYGLSYGAVAAAAGLTTPEVVATSLLMFTGASQFALVGVLGTGGGALPAAATATLLGLRNAFYGLGLAARLRVRGARRLLAAQLVIDESTAMAVARDDEELSRLAFWWTGGSVFVLWNLATLVGAVAAASLPDPEVLGLDAAAPAAFLALLAPRLRGRVPVATALAAVACVLVLTPLAPAGVPVLAAGLVAAAVALWRGDDVGPPAPGPAGGPVP